MRRKVIKQGHNTLTVTLPHKWVKDQNIQAGDEIDFEQKDTAILLSTEKKTPHRNTVLDVRGSSIPVLWRYIISAYRAGYDEITIKFDPPKKNGKNIYTGFGYQTLEWLFPEGILQLSPMEAVQALVNRLVGVEIIDQKEDYCIIKEMGETMFKEFDSSLRRIFLILLSMGDEIYNCYKTDTKQPLKSIHLVDTNLDRFEDFCLRVLNKKGYSDFKKTTTIYNTIFLLEMIGDEYKKIALHVLDMKSKPNPHLVKEFEIFKEQVPRYYKFFYKFSKEKAEEIYKMNEEAIIFLKENYSTFSDTEKEIIHHIKKIGTYIISLTELRIDLEI